MQKREYMNYCLSYFEIFDLCKTFIYNAFLTGYSLIRFPVDKGLRHSLFFGFHYWTVPNQIPCR